MYTAINYWNTYFTFCIKTTYFFYPLSKTLFVNKVKKQIIKKYNSSQGLTQNILVLLKHTCSENKNITYRHIGVVSILPLQPSATSWNKVFIYQKNKYLFSPSGEPIGIIPDAKREKKEDKADHISHPKMDKRTKVRNTLVITILTIALIAFFNYAFEGDWVSIGIFTACIVFPVLILLDGSLTKIERSRIFVIYIVAFFVIFFWAAYEQAGASLTLFASEQTNRDIFGWEMPASWFQSFNPLFVVVLAYIMPGVWGFLNKRKMEPASPTKQAIGLLLLSLGYLFICFGVKDAVPGVKVSMIWLTGLYFIHTMGEIALSPIGLSMVNKLSPLRFASLMMGIWYLSTATANKFAGMLSGLYPEAGKVKSIFGYQIATMYDFFMVFVVMSGVASLILFLLSKKLQKMMHGVE